MRRMKRKEPIGILTASSCTPYADNRTFIRRRMYAYVPILDHVAVCAPYDANLLLEASNNSVTHSCAKEKDE